MLQVGSTPTLSRQIDNSNVLPKRGKSGLRLLNSAVSEDEQISSCSESAANLQANVGNESRNIRGSGTEQEFWASLSTDQQEALVNGMKDGLGDVIENWNRLDASMKTGLIAMVRAAGKSDDD